MTPDAPVVWDAHACFPLRPNADLSALARYHASGVDVVSLNIGMDLNPLEDVIQVAAGYRRYLQAHPERYVLANSVTAIHQAKAAGRLAVTFDLEGAEPLRGDLSLIALFYDLGVRQMLLAYNQDNRASGGCLEGRTGLTEFGRAVIREMNRVGMVVDLSHMGAAATLEACALATRPVIFSHSNPAAVHPHPRNITDAQIRACAQTGGVVGINGIGAFLGGAQAARVVEHLGYVIELVGPAHVGLGLDYVIDQQELIDYLTAHPEAFPPGSLEADLAFVAPEQIGEIAAGLRQAGYASPVIAGVLGGNFLRVAAQNWAAA